MAVPPFVARYLASILTTQEQRDRVAKLHFQDAGHRYDAFGLHPAFCSLWSWRARLPYEKYFRVRSVGADSLPSEGAAILAANHSGNLPFDGMMLWNDVLETY